MLYSVDALKKEIRILLDQNMTSEQLLGTDDIDTLALEDIIESRLVDAARIVQRDAPVFLLGSGEAFGDSIEWESAVGYGSGRIRLPDDFLRLVTFRMTDWSRAVIAPITEEDPLYAVQQSRYPGIRGNPQKPVAAIVTCPDGQYLEFFSCSGGSDVSIMRARYIPIPAITDKGKIYVCEKLRPAVAHYAAGMVAGSVGEEGLSQKLFASCNVLMQR